MLISRRTHRVIPLAIATALSTGALACIAEDDMEPELESLEAIAPFNPGEYHGSIVWPYSGRCVDIPYANYTNGNKLMLWDCWGGLNQSWVIDYFITSLGYQAGAPLMKIDQPVGSGNGTQLQIWNGSGPGEKWTLSGKLIESHRALCLDIPNGNIATGQTLQFWTCNGIAAAQNFDYFTSDNTIRPQSNHGYCLDINMRLIFPGQLPVVWPCDGSSYQKWIPTSLGIVPWNFPQYSIDKDMAGGYEHGGQPGSRAVLWPSHGMSNQYIHFEGTIANQLGYCMDNRDANYGNGAIVEAWQCVGNINQQWEFWP